MNEEIWKDIKGYEGVYQVSNKGNVRSIDRIVSSGRKRKGKTILPSLSKGGYFQISLSKNNKKQMKLVHRLVAVAFLSNPEKKKEVNHKNGDKTDNRATNLEWVSRSENMNHAFTTGLKSGKPRRKLTEEQAKRIREEYSFRERGYGTYSLAKKYKVSQKTILSIVHNKTYN